MTNQIINNRLTALREEMRIGGIDVYIVPSADPHKSEYVTDRFKARAYITGFSGSAGLAVITMNECHLWTDGRYFIQAGKELKGTDIILEKMLEPGVKSYHEWVNDYVSSGMTIGYDEKLFSVNDVSSLKKSIKTEDITFNGANDFFSSIWTDRPELPLTPIYIHEFTYTGQSTQDKLIRVRKAMAKQSADFYVLSALNDIAWLFNIRADDVLYTPVVYAYALITPNDSILYVHGAQVSPVVNEYFTKSLVTQRPYERIYDDIANIPSDSSIIYDPAFTNSGLAGKISEGCRKIEADELTAHIKAKLHPIEITNLKHCQIKDGVALTKFLYWLDRSIGTETLTEIDVARKLLDFRSKQDGFIEPSFETISAYESNAAMMHYSTDPDNSPNIYQRGFLLVDSGGQYYDGTTDITRTIVLGDLTDEAKVDFTLVLKGHINLARFIFLKGTSGNEIDAIARQPIWQHRKDYKSGTGHGVGYLLGVHEGIQRIARKSKPIPLALGMVVTNEPGIYIENKYGIRTENTLLVQADTENEYGTFYHFDTISFCPIDIRAIKSDMLSSDELEWLNNYHKAVYDHLSPFLEEEEIAWLGNMTKAL
ncbi:MAG: aminopeptidase P family protein [Vallitaleaceae bacterium]|nr:aminopeptidase P family protein [Vallitaleaceae bacterium]